MAIGLLGDFIVRVDGTLLPADAWQRRSAAALVKLLALAPRRRLPRERVLDALWPQLPVDAALPRLHKAAHYARRAIGAADAVVLEGGSVALLPGADVLVDVEAFDSAADLSLGPGSAPAAALDAAIGRYHGELLPDDLDQDWAQAPRQRLRSKFEQLLRAARRWPALLALDPADEQAHVELLREAVLAGRSSTALRRYDELARALADELGVTPGPEAVALRERALTMQRSGPGTSGRAPRVDRGPDEGGTLLEREEQLATLARILRSVMRTGRGAVVSVTGEAGSGKSSLVRAFLAAVDPDVQVAAGSCDDLLAPPSLGPFRDMAQDLPALGRALADQRPPEEIFPVLLNALAARPTVLLVEDAHWADDVTLDAIRYLSRRIPGTPSMLLLTFRDEEVDLAHPLRRVLGGLGGGSSRQLELAPLSVAAVRRLGGVDAAEALRIHRVTKGNPFFVTEILATSGDTVPATVRDAVLARVGRLPPASRALAQRLAVVPSRAERWLADALAGEQPDAVPQAERSGVLSGATGFVSFRHELGRQALESSLTVGERVRAHRDVLEVLLARPQPEPARIVHHAVRAARPDLVERYGPVAAAEAERAGAHRQAAETLRVVLDLGPQLAETTRASLLTRRAYSLYLVNEYESALTVAEQAVTAADGTRDAPVTADALVVLSRIAYFARGPLTARRAAERAVELLRGRGDTPGLAEALTELARTHSNLATIGIVAQPSVIAVRAAEQAVALCRRLARDAETAEQMSQPLCYLGSARLALGDRRGLRDIDEAIEIARTASRLETRVRGHVNAAGALYRAGRFEQAERHVAEGLRVADDGAFLSGQYRLLLTSAGIAACAGSWDRAVAVLRGLLDGPGDAGIMAPLARSMLARLLARRGDRAARAVLGAALDDSVAAGDPYVVASLAVAQVEVGWLIGAPPREPDGVATALRLAVDVGHTAIAGELATYLRRAGWSAPVAVSITGSITGPVAVPEPWAASLAGRPLAAAAAWDELGERYERAVELAGADDHTARDQGLRLLSELGASAAVARLRAADG